MEMHKVSYPAISIGAKTDPFELIKNLVEIWSPKSRRGQSKDNKDVEGLHDDEKSSKSFIYTDRWCTLEP